MGDTIRLKCGAMSSFNMPPPDIAWFHFNSKLNSTKNELIQTTKQRRTKSVLTIQAVNEHNLGVYRCRAYINKYDDFAEAQLFNSKCGFYLYNRNPNNNGISKVNLVHP